VPLRVSRIQERDETRAVSPNAGGRVWRLRVGTTVYALTP
jgi:hypothetical protein